MALPLLLFALLGLAVGSFGNVLIIRLAKGESIGGRSHCPRCKKILGAFELIPLVSFFLQRGCCRGCGKSISWQYPLVEAASAGLFIFALVHEAGSVFPAFFLALALVLFLFLAVGDAKTGLLPDALTIPLLVCSILYAALSPPFPVFAPLLGAAFFGIQWFLSRGKWIGSGDIFVGAAMGFLLLDWPIMVIALAASYIIGAPVALALLIAKRKQRTDHLPFVPFLFVGTMVALHKGTQILIRMNF